MLGIGENLPRFNFNFNFNFMNTIDRNFIIFQVLFIVILTNVYRNQVGSLPRPLPLIQNISAFGFKLQGPKETQKAVAVICCAKSVNLTHPKYVHFLCDMLSHTDSLKHIESSSIIFTAKYSTLSISSQLLDTAAGQNCLAGPHLLSVGNIEHYAFVICV